MKLTISNSTKLFLVFIAFSISVMGFMLKLPSAFRRYDKELHSLFYFVAAAFLNILIAQRKILIHLVIFGTLYLFGVCIELAQEYSNKFFNKRIHGRYDVEDVQSNLKGLIAFSALWFTWVVIYFIYKKVWHQNKV
jgi:hypothetical protein